MSKHGGERIPEDEKKEYDETADRIEEKKNDETEENYEKIDDLVFKYRDQLEDLLQNIDVLTIITEKKNNAIEKKLVNIGKFIEYIEGKPGESGVRDRNFDPIRISTNEIHFKDTNNNEYKIKMTILIRTSTEISDGKSPYKLNRVSPSIYVSNKYFDQIAQNAANIDRKKGVFYRINQMFIKGGKPRQKRSRKNKKSKNTRRKSIRRRH